MPRRCRLPGFCRAAPGRRAESSRSPAAPTAVRRSRSSATVQFFERTETLGSGRADMQGVHVVDHPLVQHKLTLIRDENRSTKSFRELLKEIGMLLCYEVTRDLPLTEVEVETPLKRMQSARIAGKKLVFVP